MVSHSSKQQLTITCLSIEVKYIILCQIIKEVIWLYLFKLELKDKIFLIILKINNKGSIALLFNPEFYKQIKHINIKTQHIYEIVT